jgi:DNA-binding CsgD family transcriptional regulator
MDPICVEPPRRADAVRKAAYPRPPERWDAGFPAAGAGVQQVYEIGADRQRLARLERLGEGAFRQGPDRLLLLRILDEIDYGLMLVEASGGVRYANAVAVRECAGATGLCLQDQRLRACHARDQSDLLRAFERALQGQRSLLSLVTQGPPQSVAVIPVDAEHSGEPRTTMLLVFGKRRACEPLSVEFFARMHELTHAEMNVVRGLCDGLSPAQIAQRIGVAISTIRTQIGSIRTKTETASIRDLVGRITSLPPIVQVLEKERWNSGPVANAA